MDQSSANALFDEIAAEVGVWVGEDDPVPAMLDARPKMGAFLATLETRTGRRISSRDADAMTSREHVTAWMMAVT